MRHAELAGLAFAFRARAVAIAVVALWLLVLVPWPRGLYYLAAAGLFFVLGTIPYGLRRHRHAWAIKLAFTVLDVALMSAVIIVPPPAGLGVDWPIQTRLRTPEFLYVLLLLGEAALTYRPLAVLWTGTWIAAIWSLGVWWSTPARTPCASPMPSATGACAARRASRSSSTRPMSA